MGLGSAVGFLKKHKTKIGVGLSAVGGVLAGKLKLLDAVLAVLAG